MIESSCSIAFALLIGCDICKELIQHFAVCQFLRDIRTGCSLLITIWRVPCGSGNLETMSMWMFQLSQKYWSPQNFRCDIWEGRSWHWGHQKIQSSNHIQPQPGDVMFFFFSKDKCDEPGIYGWAVVDRLQNETIYFTPTAPTNHLKIDPWWNTKDVQEKIIDVIRRKQPQATVFEVPDEIVPLVKRGMKRWLSGIDSYK
jgi:hypothetical protein